MNQIGANPAGTSNRRTVQDYIDEIPIWPDGTQLTKLPMTGMQWRIWGLAIAGKFFEGLVVFMTGVALPLISKTFGLHAVELSYRHRRLAVRHSDRRHRAGRHGGYFWPQNHVHRGNGVVHAVSWSHSPLRRASSGWSSACSASASRWAATIPPRIWSSPKRCPAAGAAGWCSAPSPSRRSAPSAAPGSASSSSPSIRSLMPGAGCSPPPFCRPSRSSPGGSSSVTARIGWSRAAASRRPRPRPTSC